MAQRVKNIKRFAIIKTNVVELSVIDGCIVPGICDFCNKPHFRGFVVPVLGHWWSCRKCLSAWLKRAESFPEDAEFERLCFNEYKSRFSAKGLWRDADE